MPDDASRFESQPPATLPTSGTAVAAGETTTVPALHTPHADAAGAGADPVTSQRQIIAEAGPASPSEPAPATGADPDAGAWRRAALAGLVIWVGTRVALMLFSTIVWVGEWQRLRVTAVAYKWGTQFDSWYFLTIAKEGYLRTADQAYAAFFPLYPALIRVLTPVCGGKGWLAGLVVSNLALLAVLILLHRFAEHEMGRSVAGRSTFYLVAFPTGFFLTAAYNEGLFIALMLGSIYAMRRGKWWVAGLLGALAGTTRSAGLLLVAPFAYEYLRQHGRRLRPDVIAGAIIPLGLATVMIVNKVAFGDPMAFSNAQSGHWGRHLDWPWVPFYQAVMTMIHQGAFTEIWIHNSLELGTVLLLLTLLTLAVVGPWRMRRDQLVLPLFGLILVVFMVSFPSSFTDDIPYPLLSTSRIGLEVFPAFWMLGRITRHPAAERVTLMLFLTVQGVLAAHFLHGHWIA